MDRLKDEERARIARELHDGLAQTLAGIRFRTRTWKTLVDREPDRLLPELDELTTILDVSIQDVRRSIYDLRPISLEQFGLATAVLRFTKDLENMYEVNIQTDFQNLEAVPARLEHDLFRISQELVYNAVRHGRPQMVSIIIQADQNRLSLQVKDDGIGFDPEHVQAKKIEGHFGLIQVQERVALLQGSMSVTSQPNQGTNILIQLPLSDDS
jgi:two-component system sensor histidine kinase DegS